MVRKIFQKNCGSQKCLNPIKLRGKTILGPSLLGAKKMSPNNLVLKNIGPKKFQSENLGPKNQGQQIFESKKRDGPWNIPLKFDLNLFSNR